MKNNVFLRLLMSKILNTYTNQCFSLTSQTRNTYFFIGLYMRQICQICQICQMSNMPCLTFDIFDCARDLVLVHVFWCLLGCSRHLSSRYSFVTHLAQQSFGLKLAAANIDSHKTATPVWQPCRQNLSARNSQRLEALLNRRPPLKKTLQE